MNEQYQLTNQQLTIGQGEIFDFKCWSVEKLSWGSDRIHINDARETYIRPNVVCVCVTAHEWILRQCIVARAQINAASELKGRRYQITILLELSSSSAIDNLLSSIMVDLDVYVLCTCIIFGR